MVSTRVSWMSPKRLSPSLLRHIRKVDLTERNIRASSYKHSRAANCAISEARSAKSRGDPVVLESAARNERGRERESPDLALLVVHDNLSTRYFTREEGSLSLLAPCLFLAPPEGPGITAVFTRPLVASVDENTKRRVFRAVADTGA